MSPIRFQSNLRQVIKIHKEFGVAMVRGAALVVQNQAKLNVRGGFKSGAFVTGRLMNSIAHEVVAGLNPRARVGTTVDYGAWWELGHFNIFTGNYEREEWLAPAFRTTTVAQKTAAVAAIKAVQSRGGLRSIVGTSLLSTIR